MTTSVAQRECVPTGTQMDCAPAGAPLRCEGSGEGAGRTSGLDASEDAGSVGQRGRECPTAREDRRSVRTRRALRDALAAEIRACGGLDRVAVTAIAERADVTRRTFYSHYRDIPDLVERSEEELLADLRVYISRIAEVRLADLYDGLSRLEPCPGSQELLEFVHENGDYLGAMLGPGGDPGLAEKIKVIARETVTDRALDGLDARAMGPFFDYYLTYVVSAEVGVIQRWLEGGMRESAGVMARVMTMLAFMRPGDLYGRPIEGDLPKYTDLLTTMLVQRMGSAERETER